MGSIKISWFYLLFFALASILPTLNANVYHWDEYWLQRRAEAHKQSQKFFDENSKKNEVLAKLHKEKLEAIKAMAKAKAEAKLKVLAEADAQAKLIAEAAVEFKKKGMSDVEAEAQAKLKVKAQAELKIKAEAQVQGKLIAEAQKKLDAKVKAEAEAKAKLGVKVGDEATLKVGAGAGAGAEAQGKLIAEAEARLNAQVKAEAEAKLGVNGKAAANLKKHAGPDAKAKLGAKGEAEAALKKQVGVEAKLKAGAKVQAKKHVGAKAEAEAELKKHVEAEADAKAKLGVKGEAEAELKKKLEAKLKIKGEIKPKLNATTGAQLKKHRKVAAESKVVGSGNSNSTRRELRGRKYNGPCMAINSIDKCWRCDRNWALNRKKLADCARGFGEKAQGGKNGRIYVVTDPSDNNVVNPRPGTLRHAVIQLEPLWIIFARSMTIRLSQELIVTSHKTIDARGSNVHIAYGAGITLQFVKNIIITNLHIHHIVESSGGMIRDSVNHVGFRTHNEGDGISIFGSRDIWLDHLSMSHCKDGLIDAVQGSTAITISNCHFTDHDKVMLFGASDTTDVDDKMQITVAFNHFGKRLIQRMPRCRSGFFHLVNNDYTHWEMYAIGGSHHATIISQGNRFIAPPNLPPWKKSMLEITHRDASNDWKKWTWVSDGDIFQNGAFFRSSGDLNGARTYAALELVKPSPASEVGRLTRFSGSLPCRQGRPC